MNLLETMLKRRSIRTYTNDTINQETINQILQAALLAPTSRNLQPCEFILVQDKDTLTKLSQCKTAGAGMLANAYSAIVVLGDTNRSDVWIEDCSIAMTYMHLMAASLGVGSCWIQCRLRNGATIGAEEYIRNLLNIPSHYGVLAILSLGIAQKDLPEHTLSQCNYDKIHLSHF